jgi:hypothetical protein
MLSRATGKSEHRIPLLASNGRAVSVGVLTSLLL